MTIKGYLVLSIGLFIIALGILYLQYTKRIPKPQKEEQDERKLVLD